MLDAAALRNTLVVRTDRIGDVLLTLPMAGALKRRVPGARVTFLVREYTRPLVAGHPDVDDVISCPQLSDIADLIPQIRAQRYSAVFLPSPRYPVARAMARAGIPIRVGTRYRWYSRLFTERIPEHRKLGVRHEAQYNIRMFDRAAEPTPASDPSRLTLSATAIVAANAWRIAAGIATDAQYIIVHPGSGGSARDWPARHFALLASRVSHELGATVVLTGTTPEQSLLDTIDRMTGTRFLRAVDLPLDVLAALIAGAQCVVSNSTGVLHIASAVDTHAVGIYPPVVACSPRRWGPWTDNASVFEPRVNVPCGSCDMTSCPNFDCMRMIDVERVLDAVRNRVRTVQQ